MRFFKNMHTGEVATVENVTAAVLRLSTLDEAEIEALVSSGKLLSEFPFHVADEMPADEMSGLQLARMAAPARALTDEERARVENGMPARAPMRSKADFLSRAKLRLRKRSGSSSSSR